VRVNCLGRRLHLWYLSSHLFNKSVLISFWFFFFLLLICVSAFNSYVCLTKKSNNNNNSNITKGWRKWKYYGWTIDKWTNNYHRLKSRFIISLTTCRREREITICIYIFQLNILLFLIFYILGTSANSNWHQVPQ